MIFTQDAGFFRLVAKGEAYSGIVYAPQGIPVGVIIKGMKLVCDVLEAGDMAGHVEFISYT